MQLTNLPTNDESDLASAIRILGHHLSDLSRSSTSLSWDTAESTSQNAKM
jgi:hypothetical protein